MNRTLLLIICDFLLLNLLALTRWEKAEPPRERSAPVPQIVASAASAQNQDLLDLMKIAMEDELASRERLIEELRQTQSHLQTREQTLAQVQTQRTQLESALRDTERRTQDLAQQLSAAAQDATVTKERLAQIHREYDAKRAEADRQQQQITELARQKAAVEQQKAQVEQQKAQVERQFENLNTAIRVAEVEKKVLYESLTHQLQRELETHRTEADRQRDRVAQLQAETSAAQQQIASLNTAVQVAEVEKKILSENLLEMKQEVTVVREEKSRIQEQTVQLAGSVAQLAEQSSELTQEIREHRPLNANTLFSEFLTNRVDLSIAAMRPGLFGPVNRSKDSSTVLVSDGTRTFALTHIQDTPFSLGEVGVNWDNITGRISKIPHSFPFTLMTFMAADPRLIVVPVAPEHATTLGVKVYRLASDPFRFPEAVLVSKGGRYYGETEFKLDPKTPQYVRMKTKIFNRLFGEFSPSTGDLVLSKTGELLGVMVNNEYCAVVRSFDSHLSLSMAGTRPGEGTAEKLEEMYFRLVRLPFRLQ
jgi:septal ring factor EnvC (AmiA/AmiB activator)